MNICFHRQNQVLTQNERGYAHEFIKHALKNTDQRVKEGQTVNPGFLLAAILWGPIRIMIEEYSSNGHSDIEATRLAGDTIISKQISSTSIPRLSLIHI